MPIDILTNKPVDYKEYSKIIFGSYGRVIHETNTKNTTAPRKLGVIYLQALDTLQGGFEVMSLLKGKIISCCKAIKIIITQKVIDRDDDIAKKDGIKYLLKSKNRKEGIICQDDGKNDEDDASITGVDDEDGE